MKYRPILFNNDMVKAILQGRKTQTRRIVKAKGWMVNDIPKWKEKDDPEYWFTVSNDKQATVISIRPPCDRGDILWVREAWCNLPVSPGGHTRLMRGRYYYKADTLDIRPDGWKRGWKPSIHMPKEAARLFLRVTDVRAERLQEITKEAALAEGADEVESWGGRGDFFKLADYTISNYAKIWDKTVPKADLPRYGWEANPWVWVIEFERIEKPEGWI